MTKPSKAFIFILFIIIFFSSSPNLNIIRAHNGEVHPETKVYICDGKRVSFFKYFFLNFFKYRNSQRCRQANVDINPSHNESTTTPSPIATIVPNTLTPSIKPTTTPKATIQPLETHSPTTKPSATQQPITTGVQPNQYWHLPSAHDGLNVHEHGDKPPAWAEDFSQKNFGHTVMFGGDEATPGENVLKHQAYKGFLMTASGVDIFIRYHSMSAPHDRSGALHSYEVYAKDGSSNVSFWQGYIFHGYPNMLDQRMPRHGEQPGFDPIYNITWPGRNQFIISGSDTDDWKDYKRCEQWYGHAGVWSWDLSITICGATTYFTPNEHLTDVYNQSTWHLTGDKGGSRRLEVSHYGPTNPNVGGDNLPFGKWFCVKKLPNENKTTGATPTWNVGEAVGGPNMCAEGWLPQFVADTFPKAGVYFKTGNTAEKDFPTTGVTVPN